jgi:hypothetical protein
MTDAMGKSDVRYEIKSTDIAINAYSLERNTTLLVDSF